MHVTWLFGMCAYFITRNASNSTVHSFIFVNGTWLIHTWDMTHWYVFTFHHADAGNSTDHAFMFVWMSHVPYMNDSCPTWRIYAAYLLHMGHESFIYGTWLIHQCEHSATHDNDNSTVHASIFIYGTHDSFIHGTWLIHIWDMTHSTTHDNDNSTVRASIFIYGTHDSFIHGTWLIHIWDMTHSTTHDNDNSTVRASIPRVEWRGLKIRGGNFIPRKVVFYIFRC